MTEASTRPPLVVASTNQGKIAELTDMLVDRYTVLGRPDDLPDTVEDGDTLEANASKKAIEVASHTGTDALADDTGLFVDALDGRPGVWTARYAGEDATDADNVAKLLGELADRCPADDPDARSAAFRTVIALATPDGQVRLATGEVGGLIAAEPRGDGGFGYDPVFVPVEGDGRSFGQMTMGEKKTYSHRARALAALVDLLGAG